MADDLDRASEREERERAAAIAAHFQKPTVHAVAQGYCLNCGEDFDAGSKKIYCDAACAEQHARLIKRK